MSEEKARTSAEVVEELKANFEKFTTDANLLIEREGEQFSRGKISCY
jgi:hypothetical protein